MIEIIANDQGNRTTPSVVAFSEDSSERLIGEAAKNQATLNPLRTIFDIKRLIGKKFHDPEVQSDLKYLPYPVVDTEGKPHVKGGEAKTFSAEEISAMVLAKMKDTAESFFLKPVTGAVVTVPAYFNEAQRQATKDAGKIAGLNVKRIINEPTAGALAYGLGDDCDKKRKVLVYDLGGGTFDVSILEIENDVFNVLATGGDTHLGGGDFDQRVMEHFLQLIKKKYNKDVSGNSKALGKLRRECERAKRVLSTQTQVRIEIDSFVDGMDFSEPFSRARFEELNLELFKKTLDVVKTTLEDAKLSKSEIDEIVLVGGSTRIPRVREMLKEMFDGKEPNKGVNPDEAVAYGAAVLGAQLSAESTGFTLFDVTPLSLGVDVVGGLMSVVIPRNSTVPANMSRNCITAHDQQTVISFKVLQGERALTKDCLELGSFSLTGIPPAPRGVASVDVTFNIDMNGILSVTAKDKSTQNSESITVDSYTGNLSQWEINRMITEAKSYLGKPVTGAVVTVPAYFNDAQRQATKDAGKIAGLNVKRIINEPTAGALAYGLGDGCDKKRKVLVYDLGGGTFDVSILEMENYVFRVLATGGDTHLGGGDFDQRVMEHFIQLIKKKYNKDVSGNSKALGKLRRQCERAKRVLSTQTQVRIEIDSFVDGMDFSEPFSRARFEELNSELFKNTLEVVKTTLEDAKLSKSEIDEIVLVGGSTRIPRVREMLKEMFDGKEPSKGVNPDEAVAYGAAVLGAQLCGKSASFSLFDVTPLSLGVNLFGGLMSVVIPRNTTVPANMSSNYTTTHDYQTFVDLKVLQGERALIKDCLELGSFRLTGIPAAPSGVASVNVMFNIDVDGILSVTAKDKSTQNSESIKIDSYTGNLTQREVDRMIAEAKVMAEQDKKEMERIDARNQFERFIYDVKNALNHTVKNSDDELKVESALKEAAEWLDDNERACKEDYDGETQKLADVWNPIVGNVYGSN
ncbi:Heat shock 70 kDa protein BIP2 [Linum perenne]